MTTGFYHKSGVSTNQPLTEADQKIYDQQLKQWLNQVGPRVGDFLRLWEGSGDCPAHRYEFTRFTHDWSDSIQSGGENGSFWWGGEYCSYSGGLDGGCPKSDLIDTASFRQGRVWFFSDNYACANNGVDVEIPCRVFKLREGVVAPGVEFFKQRIYLYVRREGQTDCDHPYTIEKDGYPYEALQSEVQLRAWLTTNGLVMTRPLSSGETQRLLPKE